VTPLLRFDPNSTQSRELSDVDEQNHTAVKSVNDTERLSPTYYAHTGVVSAHQDPYTGKVFLTP